jgi:uncharacterized protein DUF5947
MTGSLDGRAAPAGSPGPPSLSSGAGRPAPGGLRRFARPPGPVPGASAGEHCGLCGERLDSGHPHMVDLQHRSIACACRACALLFTRPGGRYRTVPGRVCHDPHGPLTEAEWAELQIPVAIAFFFVNSALGRVIASYPSPAGVTECELDLAAWDRLAADHPLLRSPEPDVEAILVASGAPGAPRAFWAAGVVETFLVPIDVCYSLAGALRLAWHGFDGGAEVRQIVAELLTDLRGRTRALPPAPEPAPAPVPAPAPAPGDHR